PKFQKIGHNIKYDYLVLKRAGIPLAGMAFDTMIAAYLLNSGARAFDLDTLSFNEFGFRKTKIESLIGTGKAQISMADVPLEKVAAYCCEDADFTWRLAEKLEGRLQEMKLMHIFENIEMPLIKVLAEMEDCGIRIDPIILKALSKEATIEIGKLEKKIWKQAGEEFNVASPIQLKQMLFEKLAIPTEELKRGKAGLFSTAATELEKLRGLHPIIDLIFEWRELSKLKSTYFDALPKLINPETGRLHTSYNQTIAATGRLSSSDPNLQNIPIRTELGRKIRRAFVADKKFKLVSIDYSQIELRIAAHLSGDNKMILAFQSGEDIHIATAREVFGQDEVTADMRRAAKTINFGVLYGLSAYGLKTRIPGVSQGQAQEFIDKYFRTYKDLTQYLDRVVEETRKSGYVRNEIGRVRPLPEINSSQFQVRSAAERAAINMPFQSMNADIIKMAMNKLKEDDLTTNPDCRLLLQVHDELVFEIAADEVETFVPKIVKIMSEIYKLKVPLMVEAKVGDNWEEMSKLNF
ncbi:MAG: DNA polymerase I, partial [Candidatus Liptonbacteria bacterium]|nr:DNA polymerase I [Candidatus Liptonbacteria bacterium]